MLLHVPVWLVWPIAGGIAGTAMMIAFLPIALGICVAAFGWRSKDSSAWYGVVWLLGLTGVGAVLAFLSAPAVPGWFWGVWTDWWGALLLIPAADLFILIRWMGRARRVEYEVSDPASGGVLAALHKTFSRWFPESSLPRSILVLTSGFVILVLVFIFGLGCMCGPHPMDFVLLFIGATLVAARIMGAAVGTRRLSGQLCASTMFAMAAVGVAAISQMSTTPSWPPEHRFGIPPEVWFQVACYGSAAAWLGGAVWLLVSRPARQWFTPPPPPIPARRPALF